MRALLLLLLLPICSVHAGVIVLKNNKKIVCEGPFEVDGNWVRYKNKDGDMFQLPLKLVDLERSTHEDPKPKPKKKVEKKPQKKKPEPALADLVDEPGRAPLTSRLNETVTEDTLEKYDHERLHKVLPAGSMTFRTYYVMMYISVNDVDRLRRTIGDGMPLEGELYKSHRTTPLHYATSLGYLESALVLLQSNANPNWLNKEGYTPLHVAYSENTEAHRKVAEALLKFGARVDLLDKDGQTLVHTIVYQNQPSWIKILADQHTNMNVLNRQGVTPLSMAISLDRNHMVDSLLQSLVDINENNADLTRPIHVAVGKRDALMTELLLEKGADPNVTDSRGLTPLGIAIVQRNADMVRALMDKGADLDKRSDGLSVLTIATEHENKQVLSHLLDAASLDFDMTPHLLNAVRMNKALSTGLFLERGADPNVRDEAGDPVLVIASRSGNLEIVRALLESKADVYLKGSAGLTAHAVASGPDRDEIKNLIRQNFRN